MEHNAKIKQQVVLQNAANRTKPAADIHVAPDYGIPIESDRTDVHILVDPYVNAAADFEGEVG